MFTIQQAPVPGPSIPPDDLIPAETEMVVLIQGQLCRNGAEDKCFSMLVPDYYPMDLLLNSPGSKLEISRNSALVLNQGAHNVLCNNQAFSLLKAAGLQNQTTQQNCNNKIRIRKLNNYSDYLAYHKSRKANVIEIRARPPKTESHWSIYLTYGTLGIIPGFKNQYPQLDILYYNQKGRLHTVKNQDKPYFRVWHSWFLGFWGDMWTAYTAPDLYRDQLRVSIPRAMKASEN